MKFNDGNLTYCSIFPFSPAVLTTYGIVKLRIEVTFDEKIICFLCSLEHFPCSLLMGPHRH